jgi:hypothetical protein
MTDILTLLQPAVFLGWPLGTKGSAKRWKHLKQSDMTPAYLKRLEGGNVGVAFGAVSADADGQALAGIDLDRADAVESFLAANPRLRAGWLSRGRPDRLLVIVRIAGAYPKSCKLVDGDKCPVGEWRVDGCQSIIPPSVHPDTGQPYELVSAKSPMVLPFADIHWPAGVSLSVSIETSSNDPKIHLLSNTEYPETVSHKRIGNPYPESVSEKRISKPYLETVSPNRNVEVESLVAPFIVPARGQSNRLLMGLARRVKQLVLAGQTVDTRAVFLTWWAASSANVDPEQTADEFLERFRYAVENSNGGTDLVRLWQQAGELAAPGSEKLMDDRLKRLAGLCHLLHQANLAQGHDGFHLSCRMAAQLFGVTPMVAWRWLGCLCKQGLLEQVKKGEKFAASGVASEYRYAG